MHLYMWDTTKIIRFLIKEANKRVTVKNYSPGFAVVPGFFTRKVNHMRSKWKEIISGGKVGLHKRDPGSDTEFLCIHHKRTNKLLGLLENGDRIYLYQKGKTVLNGRFDSSRGYVSAAGLLNVPENKTRRQTEAILTYDNLKLFFRSKFSITVYRPLEESPFAYYPITVSGIETPLVP